MLFRSLKSFFFHDLYPLKKVRFGICIFFAFVFLRFLLYYRSAKIATYCLFQTENHIQLAAGVLVSTSIARRLLFKHRNNVTAKKVR